MENLSYAAVYNRLYKSRVEGQKNKSILSILHISKKNDRYNYWVTKHLETMYFTQQIGKHISVSDYEIIKKINKKAYLSMRLKLRKLQHKTIEYIWRPNGPTVAKIKKYYE
jgi:hypothetical protein